VLPAPLALNVCANEDALASARASWRQAGGKFGNVAVLEGDRIKILALHPEGTHNGSAHMRSLLQTTSIGDPGTAANVLPQLAVMFQEVVHSVKTREANCGKQFTSKGSTEWTSTRMPDLLPFCGRSWTI
jgi:hypothetical protein